jgi:hypothetical protein
VLKGRGGGPQRRAVVVADEVEAWLLMQMHQR